LFIISQLGFGGRSASVPEKSGSFLTDTLPLQCRIGDFCRRRLAGARLGLVVLASYPVVVIRGPDNAASPVLTRFPSDAQQDLVAPTVSTEAEGVGERHLAPTGTRSHPGGPSSWRWFGVPRNWLEFVPGDPRATGAAASNTGRAWVRARSAMPASPYLSGAGPGEAAECGAVSGCRPVSKNSVGVDRAVGCARQGAYLPLFFSGGVADQTDLCV
jgi:hypothetical protein